jgi:hypothetical protein
MFLSIFAGEIELGELRQLAHEAVLLRQAGFEGRQSDGDGGRHAAAGANEPQPEFSASH